MSNLFIFKDAPRLVFQCSTGEGRTSIQASECPTAFQRSPNDDVRETFLSLSLDDLPPLGKSPEPEEPEEAMVASKSLPVDFFQKRWPSCKYFDLKKLFLA